MSGSVSYWLSQLKKGDADAACHLWARYSPDLLAVSRKRLSRIPKGYVDEDDIAQSVFRCICEGLMGGQLATVESRDDLWFLLLSVTFRKVAGHVQSQMALKRGAGKVRTESSLGVASDETINFCIEGLASDEPAPELSVMLEEQCARLLEKLGNENLRTLAEFRIAGYSVAEIAAEMSLSTRSIERKLSLIRDKWKVELCEAY
jgi:hypothetical protein